MKTPSQDASNTVLFEMMLHYKRRMEIAEESSAQDRKRARLAADAARNAQDALHARSMQLADARHEIEEYRRANQQGADIIVAKHQGGLRVIDAMEGLLAHIKVTYEFNPENESVVYIHDQAARAAERARSGVEMFNHIIATPEHDDADSLTADEIIDLTGEDTEEEDVGEWV